MADAATAYRQAFLNGLRPEATGTVSEWADQHRVLSGVGCPEPGPWRTSRAPYLREPMDCLSTSSRIRRVVLMFGSQLGKTEILNNIDTVAAVRRFSFFFCPPSYIHLYA